MKHDPLSADLLTNIFRTSPKDPLRIINREGSTIEFKESYSHAGMAQYFKTVAAFANNVGGYIIFGVANSPRRLVGLKEKNLTQFEELKVEEFTKNLMEYFSPEIKWSHCTFEFKGMSFGVIYTYPLAKKPCICKKIYESQNPKYTLREGDIYYRYGGRSERIHYEELNSIIETERKREEQQWLELTKRAARIGIENACLLDLNTGTVSGTGGTLVLDDGLLSKLSFIKEGEFVETKGSPTLRLIGDIQQIETGKVVVKETTRRVVKAIEASDVVSAFLKDTNVEEPFEYLRAICSEPSANYPVYFLISQADETISNAIKAVEDTTSRGVAKHKLLERLNGKMVPMVKISSSETTSSIMKTEFRKAWLQEKINVKEEELKYCMAALMSLDNEEIVEHEGYIRETLMWIYTQFYEKAKPIIASEIRKAICRIDEALFQARSDSAGIA